MNPADWFPLVHELGDYIAWAGFWIGLGIAANGFFRSCK